MGRLSFLADMESIRAHKQNLETYRSGHNELDSKSSCRLVPARGFESHRLRERKTRINAAVSMRAGIYAGFLIYNIFYKVKQ